MRPRTPQEEAGERIVQSQGHGIYSRSGRVSTRSKNAIEAALAYRVNEAIQAAKTEHMARLNCSEAKRQALQRRIAEVETLLARGMRPKRYKRALTEWKAELAQKDPPCTK